MVLCVAGGKMTFLTCEISVGLSGARSIFVNSSNSLRRSRCCASNHLPKVMSKSGGKSSLETKEDTPTDNMKYIMNKKVYPRGMSHKYVLNVLVLCILFWFNFHCLRIQVIYSFIFFNASSRTLGYDHSEVILSNPEGHYNDDTMSTITSQVTGNSIVCSTVCLD